MKTVITITKSKRHKKWSILKRDESITLIEKVSDGPNGARVGLWLNGKRVAYCSGGGYDMRHTNVANYLATLPDAQKILKKACGEYGVFYSESTKRYGMDGACGYSSVEAAFGVNISSMRI